MYEYSRASSKSREKNTEPLLKFSKVFINQLDKNSDVFHFLNSQKVDIVFFGGGNGAKENTLYYFNETKRKKEMKIILNTGHMFGSYLAKKELFKLSRDFIFKQ
jgi:hypothetical protein